MSGNKKGSRGGKGKAQGGPKRVRKVLRDNIQGISNAALHRIAFKGGVKTVDGLCYEELRGILKIHLENVIRDSLLYAENARRKSIMLKDVIAASQRNGGYLAVGLIELGGSPHVGLEGVNSRTVGLSRAPKVRKGSVKDGKLPSGKRAPSFHAGTVALRQIRHFQKQHKFAFRKLPFKRLVLEILQDFKSDDARISVSAVEAIQLYAETYLIDLTKDAYLCSLHAHRVMIKPSDYQLARKIRKERA